MTRRHLRILLLPFLAGAVMTAVAACGGGGGDKTPAPAVTKVSSIPAGAPEMDQLDLKFIPTELTVKTGQTVYFKSSEAVVHTVNINNRNISGNMKKGDIITWTPQSPGEYKVSCDYHPQMKATVIAQ